MGRKECIAMLLAGGQGSRLGALTRHIAKPAVVFGGKYRMIDFSLSNCANSRIDTIGVLTQYRPYLLNSYIGTGAAWDMDNQGGGVSILPPYATESGAEWYKGTADAIYQNIEFIDIYDPEYVLILSGDHLYRMDYSLMLAAHKEKQAELTISAVRVTWEEAKRFGILTADDNGRIIDFSEKPSTPKSNLASMGVYIFNWSLLKSALADDHADLSSSHDFGKDVIPRLLQEKRKLYAYEFSGYWKDIGTLESYYETSMDLLSRNPQFDLFHTQHGRILSNTNTQSPQYIGPEAEIRNSLVCNGCEILGHVEHSILSTDVYVAEGALVESSVLLPGARIERGARVVHAIVAEDVTIGADVSVGDRNNELVVIGEDAVDRSPQMGECVNG